MAVRLGPSNRDLERYLEQRLTYQEIADKYGVARGTIASIASRAGLSGPRLKYRATSLWSPIHQRHQAKHELNMLRVREQQLQGVELQRRVERRLTSFLTGLEVTDCVIAYAPDTERGFWHLSRDYFPDAWLDQELPIMIVRLTASA